MKLKIDGKFEGKLTCVFKSDMKNLANFHQSTFETSQKFGLSLSLFIQIRKCMSWKFTVKLCVMTMKNNSKFEQELTCQFKIDVRNLTNFDPSTQKPQKLALF